MLIFYFIALLDTNWKDLTTLTWKDSGDAEGEMGGVGIFLASCQYHLQYNNISLDCHSLKKRLQLKGKIIHHRYLQLKVRTCFLTLQVFFLQFDLLHHYFQQLNKQRQHL